MRSDGVVTYTTGHLGHSFAWKRSLHCQGKGASAGHAVSRDSWKRRRAHFKHACSVSLLLHCCRSAAVLAVYDDQPVTQSIDQRLEFCGNCCAVRIMRIAAGGRPQAQGQRNADIRGNPAPRNPKLWVTQTTSAVSLEPALPMVFRSTFTAHSTFVLATASVIWSA